MERLQKLIANSGYCSRRKAEELIESGKVLVNDNLAKLGDKADENSKIKIDGKLISCVDKKYYYMLSKPKGILVTRDDPQNRKTIYDLESVKELEKKLETKLNYVGRLDGMSEGLLILTNDGEFQNKLSHPKHHIEKTYLLRTKPALKKNDIEKLKKGVLIDDRKLFAEISTVNENEFEITISEGRNRIIRRTMEKLEYKIFMLKRIRIGNLKLGNLKEGKLQDISDKINI